MQIKLFTHEIKTQKREQLIQITEIIQEYLKKSGIQIGTCKIFIPHTTAGISINENADPDVGRDVLTAFDNLIPNTWKFLHSEGNSDAHVKAILVGCDVDIPIDNNLLLLGQWQGIYFCEFDGPRTRKIKIQFLGE